MTYLIDKARAGIFRQEIMSDHFTKYHLDDGTGLALHHFTGPDTGDPHDHPWDFMSRVLAGGYIEQIFDYTAGLITFTIHDVGSVHYTTAETIHRIYKLLDRECWTLVMAGPPRRITRFWRYGQSRAWNEGWS